MFSSSARLFLVFEVSDLRDISLYHSKDICLRNFVTNSNEFHNINFSLGNDAKVCFVFVNLCCELTFKYKPNCEAIVLHKTCYSILAECLVFLKKYRGK